MNFKLLIKEYFKYSWLFLVILFAGIIFAYSSFQNLSNQFSLVAISFTLGLFSHFTVWNLIVCLSVKLKLKSSRLITGINFIWSIIILFIVSGFYIGVKNWGAAINWKLTLSAISEWTSFGSVILNHLYIGFAAILIGAVLLFYYSQGKIKYSTNASHLIAALGTLVMILAALFVFNASWFEKNNSVKNEIFHAFLSQNKTLQRINDIDLGLANINQDIKKVKDFNKKNVLFFSIDCLRADHLSLNGYARKTSPFLDSLYDAGKLKKIQLATSTCSSSFCGILSMLNSKNLQNLTYYKYGIHDYLKYQGYRINFILSGFHESWYDIKSHYGKNIDYYIEGKSKEDFNLNDDALIVDEVKSLPDFNGDPNFFFFHFMGPHNLGHKAEEFEYFKPIVNRGIIRKLRLADTDNKDLRKLYVNNYDNGVVQTDAYIRDILKLMRQKGYLENALIVIAGDHGESLGDSEKYLGHGNALTSEYINIPILFIDDELDFYREDLYASQIDIAPTIADRLRLPIPDAWQGESLKKNIANRLTFHEQTPHGFDKSHIAVVNKSNEQIYKYILDQNTDSETFLQIDAENYTEDTLILSSVMADFYRDKIVEYKGSDYKEMLIESESSLESDVVENESDSLTSSIEIDRCDLLKIADIQNYFGANDDLIKTISFNNRRKACSTYFLWKSADNVNRHITVNIDGSRTVKRNISIVKNKLKFKRMKHHKIKYLFKSTESNSIAFISQANYLYVINESAPGSIQSVAQAKKYAELLYGIE